MTASAWVSSRPARTRVAPGATAWAKAGASSISGPARMLAISRSNGRARDQHFMIHAVGDREQQLARAMADGDVVDPRIVGGDVDADRIDVGGDALGLRPQRQRGEGEQAGAGADVGDIGEGLARCLQPVERGEAAGGGVMLAGAEGEARRRSRN